MLADIRDKNCTLCKLHQDADVVCQMGRGSKHPRVVVVSKMPNSPPYQTQLEGDLADCGVDVSECYFTAALKCRNYEADAGKRDLKACQPYLQQELQLLRPEWVLAMGNEALASTTGHSGIMKWRGRLIGPNVVATVSPASVTRNPGQRQAYLGDLRFLARQISGQEALVQPPTIHTIDTKEKFHKLKVALASASLVSFDVETTRDGEYQPGAAIVSLAVTLVIEGKIMVCALPLYHPQSVFRRSWRKVVEQSVWLIANVPKRVAQNGKFDCRWLRKMSGYETLDITFDTMLASHLLDENREKGLKPTAVSRLGVDPWGIDTKDLLTTPIAEVLEYNALDTYYTYHIYLQMRRELIEQPRLLRIFKTITMPAANLLIGVEQRGAFVDRERLQTNGKVARDMQLEIDRQLMEYVPTPDNVPDHWTWADVGWPTNSKGREVGINFRPSNFARWLLFEHLGLPVLATGKTKEDGSEGAPSMAEAVLLELKDKHPIVPLMLERARWATMVSTFFSAYDELLDENSRIHTTFKLAGTVTGRLSSGKADAEKITAGNPSRGVNLQQVPRDPLVRGIFGSPPGYTFVEGDFSQIELRIGAYMSRDRTMMRLFQSGQDIHAATAAWIMGKPISRVTKEDRKAAKAVNFGFLYGMGWRKFILTAFEKYGLIFDDDKAKEIRRLFFEQFAGLQRWHQRQRRLVQTNRRVQNPIGRIRHLPDIDSPEQGVMAEAERQAINSPVQSFGSDLCMLSLIEIDRKLQRKKIEGYVIGTVHDALMFEVKDEQVWQALPIIQDTMENLPLDKLFGLHLDVPIVADIKVGTHWGDARELTREEVHEYPM